MPLARPASGDAGVHDGILSVAAGALGHGLDDLPTGCLEDLLDLFGRLGPQLPAADVAENPEEAWVLVEGLLQKGSGEDLATGLEVILDAAEHGEGGVVIHATQDADQHGVVRLLGQDGTFGHEVALSDLHRPGETCVAGAGVRAVESLKIEIQQLPHELVRDAVALVPESLERVRPRTASEIDDARARSHEVVREEARTEVQAVAQRLAGERSAQKPVEPVHQRRTVSVRVDDAQHGIGRRILVQNLGDDGVTRGVLQHLRVVKDVGIRDHIADIGRQTVHPREIYPPPPQRLHLLTAITLGA